jgi:hypothetical protein
MLAMRGSTSPVATHHRVEVRGSHVLTAKRTKNGELSRSTAAKGVPLISTARALRPPRIIAVGLTCPGSRAPWDDLESLDPTLAASGCRPGFAAKWMRARERLTEIVA